MARIRSATTLSAVGLVVVSAVLTSAVSLYVVRRALLADTHSRIAIVAEEASRPLDAIGIDLLADVTLLSQLPAIKAYALEKPRTRSGRENAQGVLVALVATRPAVLQARLIAADAEGMELIRVERGEGGAPPRVVAEADLQAKRERPYMRAAIASPGPQLGRIELNREHERLQVPHVPVLRGAMHLPGPSEVVVVINVDVRRYLDGARSTLPDGHELWVADERGELLLHPDPSLAFRFEHGGSSSLRQLLPGVALPQTGRELVTCETANHVRALRRVPLGPKRYMTVHTSVPTKQASRFARAGAVGAGAILLVLLVPVVWFGVHLGRRIALPIERLDAAARVGGRSVEQLTFPSSAPKEVVALAGALESLHRQVRERQESLDQELEQRNRELTARNTELSQSNADLEQFAYVCSHDLQEPLRMVAGYTELIEDEYDQLLDDDGREYLRFARQGALRMQGLLNDLLKYSRVQSVEFPFEPVPLADCLAGAQANLSVAIAEADAVITHGGLPVVAGSSPMLSQVLQNLLENSLRYRSPERRLEVHVEARRISDEHQISLTDNGIGIEPRYAERIFEIFERLHHPDEHPGRGIGLAICKRVIGKHGGRIWATGTPGVGATLFFTLPARDLPPDASEA